MTYEAHLLSSSLNCAQFCAHGVKTQRILPACGLPRAVQIRRRARTLLMKSTLIAATVTAIVATTFVWSTAQESQAVRQVATLADLRPLSPDEIARATYFDQFGVELLRPGDDITFGGGHETIPPPGRVITLEQRLNAEACKAHAVAVVTQVAARSMLNNRGTFIFTDIRASVEDWVRPAAGPNQVTISVGGGPRTSEAS